MDGLERLWYFDVPRAVGREHFRQVKLGRILDVAKQLAGVERIGGVTTVRCVLGLCDVLGHDCELPCSATQGFAPSGDALDGEPCFERKRGDVERQQISDECQVLASAESLKSEHEAHGQRQ